MDQRHLPWLAPRAHLAILLPPGVIRFGRGRLLFLDLGLAGSYRLRWNRTWNLLPTHRPTAIANLQAPIFPFAHCDFALGRRIIPGLSFHLEVAVVVPYHPVVANDSPPFQMKNFLQLYGPRGRSMIVPGVASEYA